MFCLFMFVCFLIALLRCGFPFCLASFFPSFLLAKVLPIYLINELLW